MSDNELLMAAAKAAGMMVMRDAAGAGPIRDCTNADPMRNIYSCPEWNPLTDDGDALRLAVKLELRVVTPWHSGGYKRARADCIPTGSDGPWVEDADPYTATRRAIVRAAAALARVTESAASPASGSPPVARS
jgi:hypothetical protein